jgi:peptide deformylase
MALRQIRLYGDDILRKKAKPVKKITPNILELLDDMAETLREKNGLGLAAPQVGVLRRIAVVVYEDNVYEMINPVIVDTDGVQRRNEACLSVPGKSGDIDRPLHVKVEATNRNGETFTVVGDELLAVAICHELDHLDGILILDRAVEIKDASEDDEEEEES